ncbi:hypothetical protein D3C80_1308240 [compost metagenome]
MLPVENGQYDAAERFTHLKHFLPVVIALGTDECLPLGVSHYPLRLARNKVGRPLRRHVCAFLFFDGLDQATTGIELQFFQLGAVPVGHRDFDQRPTITANACAVDQRLGILVPRFLKDDNPVFHRQVGEIELAMSAGRIAQGSPGKLLPEPGYFALAAGDVQVQRQIR